MKNPIEFTLEKYSGKKSRFTCPKCNRAGEFTRYVHPETGERLPPYVGICNRKDKCGYAYSNGDYIRENPGAHANERITSALPKPVIPPSFMNWALLSKSMSHYPENNLYLFLCNLVGMKEAEAILAKYYVGTSKHWAGASVYWQVDLQSNVRSGKVMLYNSETGKRQHKKQTWVHAVMGLKGFNLSQCLFGEHLLGLEENREKGVAIVESEKTAIIASRFIDSVVWLATGGLELLNPATNPAKFKPLIGRQVILYPDLSLPNSFNGDTAFKSWTRKAEFLRFMGVKVTVSELLENVATDEERENGFDIADYLIRK
ncbi:DUF6371 domain-containing protein [Williamwhitmania taraxaci]|uniref:Toprim-like n=1 Tax=Williamwhitmania taraxaci TaxID=1640674 RepID=A0A1G6GGC2_9BACT|nr:DUF6371 domain-containing protein [Williamwhitmania taraxaci]SDB80939.1 hypothetical protein SAMN05216323_10012 [Williamwhitmania taraxaci]